MNNNNKLTSLSTATIAQIAAALQVTRQAVTKRANSDEWPYTEQTSRGGKRRVYSINDLPADVRIKLAAQLTSEAAAAGRHAGRKVALQEKISDEAAFNRRLSGLKTSLHQPFNAQRRIDAKLAILSAFERFHQAAGLAIRVSHPDFARRYNLGEIAVEPWVREQFPDVSDASLWRWGNAVKQHGVSALGGEYGNRRGDSIIDRQPELQEFAVSMLVSHPHSTTGHLMAAMRARFNGHNAIDYPSPRALQRWVANWKQQNKQAFAAIRNPDAWKNTYMAAFGSQSEDVERVNQRWELDSTPGDVMLTDGRHVVIGVVDVKSRRGKLLVSKTSRATAIATLLRHALLEWGVPEVAKTDNGSDYTSHHIQRVFASLDVEQQLCPPFQPWHKPHVERFFKTFSHDLVELLPGFIGHDVAERKAIEARASFADRLMKRGGVLDVKLSSAEFQNLCDRWCEDLYARHPNKGLAGKTPFEILAANRDPIRTITDERALDILLADAPGGNGVRTVQKKGVELDRAWFIAPELGARIGDQVHVRHDPMDLGRIYVFDLEEGYICTAECPERTGMDRRDVAIKAKAMQLAGVQEQRRALKATAKRVKTDDVVREILIERAERADKLTRLPGRAAQHTSAGLAAAAAAARPPAPPKLASDEERAALAALEREMADGAARKVVALDSPEINYRRWLALDARLTTGERVTEEEAAWHRSYQGCDEWRANQRMAEDFPEYGRM